MKVIKTLSIATFLALCLAMQAAALADTPPEGSPTADSQDSRSWIEKLIPSTPSSLGADLQRFVSWFAGEYDNYEQVWQQKIDQADDPLEHIHHIFKAVDYPALGEYVFFVKQYMDGDADKVYRQRLYSFSINKQEQAIQLTIYSFADDAPYRQVDSNPALLDGLDADTLKTIPGCEVFWRWNGEYFDGYMKKDACTFLSKRSGKRIFINDTLRLTDSWLWIQDQAHDAAGQRIFGHEVPHKNRKVKFYRGWMALRADKLAAGAAADDWVFMQIARLHNEGQRLPFVDKDGKNSGYSLALESLTYQNTGVPILKLGLIEDATGQVLAYAWAEPASPRIGINLGWFQAGLTRLEE